MLKRFLTSLVVRDLMLYNNLDRTHRLFGISRGELQSLQMECKVFYHVNLRIIECMKKAGMSLKDIRIYIELAMQGDSTIDARLAMFRRQQDTLRAQMQQLQDTMQVLEYKCWYYETAQKLGSIDAVKNLPDKDIPAEMQAVKAHLCDCPDEE